MLGFILSLLMLVNQSDRIEFQLTNTSNDAIKIEIPGFRMLTLEQDQISEVRFHPGQEVYALTDVDGDQREDRLLILVVDSEHSGELVKVDKHLKKAAKEYASKF